MLILSQVTYETKEDKIDVDVYNISCEAKGHLIGVDVYRVICEEPWQNVIRPVDWELHSSSSLSHTVWLDSSACRCCVHGPRSFSDAWQPKQAILP